MVRCDMQGTKLFRLVIRKKLWQGKNLLGQYDIPGCYICLRKEVFNQNCSPPHPPIHVQCRLGTKFSIRCIGRAGLTTRPPRSRYMTSLQFLLWHSVKTFIFSAKMISECHMKKIVWQSIEKSSTPTLLTGRKWELLSYLRCNGNH